MTSEQLDFFIERYKALERENYELRGILKKILHIQVLNVEQATKDVVWNEAIDIIWGKKL